MYNALGQLCEYVMYVKCSKYIFLPIRFLLLDYEVNKQLHEI